MLQISLEELTYQVRGHDACRQAPRNKNERELVAAFASCIVRYFLIEAV